MKADLDKTQIKQANAETQNKDLQDALAKATKKLAEVQREAQRLTDEAERLAGELHEQRSHYVMMRDRFDGEQALARRKTEELEAMQKRVEEEGKKETELYEKYMCYCKTAGGDLSASLADAGSSISDLGNKIKAAEEQKKVLASELKTAQSDRSAAKKAMAEGTAVREKEAAAFANEKAKTDKDIAAAGKAITAIGQGMETSFLQSTGAQLLRNVLLSKHDLLMEDDRQDVLSFLSGSQEYAQSGQILGILKQMYDEMVKVAKDAQEAENAGIKTFEELMAAKKGS